MSAELTLDQIIEAEERRKLLLRARRSQLVARDDLIEFARYMRPHPDHMDDVRHSLYDAADHVRLIAHYLQLLESGKIKRLIIDCPPRHGKTELASKTATSWVMGRNPAWHTITATYNDDFATEFGRAVRDLVKHPRFAHVFPAYALKAGSSSVDRLESTRGGIATFVGRQGSTTGRGAHWLTIDDPIKDRKQADSPTLRKDLWWWFTQVLSTRLMTEEGRILLIQTRWHEDDLVGRLTDPNNPEYKEEEARQWTHLRLPALADEDDPLGRKMGTALWPARFGTAFLAQRRNQDPRGFSALYQGRPSPEDGAFFKQEDIREYHHIRQFPKNGRIYAASDHAVSLDQSGDKSALGIASLDEQGNLYIHPDSQLTRLPTDQIVELMLNLIKVHKPLFWWAERGHISKSIGPFLRKRMLEEQVFCAIHEVVPANDKQTRAQSIKARMSMGKVYLPSFAPWYPEARRQLLSFPQGAKDDFVDLLSLFGLGLNMQHSVRPPKSKTKEVRPGTLGWVKEQSRRQARDKAVAKDLEGW